ncbi:hypothetical protein A8B98_12615 [Hymenobacter sp. UV11]|nr:hypothetical protein A8B98_12615 [Hymenobacter sp. UV11]
MGMGVVQALYGALSKIQQQELTAALGLTEKELLKLPLPDFAQYFVDLHGGNKQRLIQVITQLFSATPLTKATHEQVAALPYFDRIVTTNYDQLFEIAYSLDKLHVITQADNVPQLDDKPTVLFKIHGELNRPKSLIITKEDYGRFFDKADDVVWTQLRSLMSTRTVVFVGYAVEDPNVLDVFLELANRLGELMRPAYVVGPSMDFLRVQRLKRQNIHFIQATGEAFVEELMFDIKDKALTELSRDGFGALKPVSQMLSTLGLDFSVKVDGSGPLIKELIRRDGPTHNKFTVTSSSSQIQEAIQALINGQVAKPVKIVADNFNQIAHFVEGFRLPSDGDAMLWLTRAPGWEDIVDIRFSSGLLLSGTQVKVYGKRAGINLVVLSATSRLELSMNSSGRRDDYYDCDAQFDRRMKPFADVASALECVGTMQALSKGESIKVLKNGVTIWRSTKRLKMHKPKQFSSQATNMGNLIALLPKIEQTFGILFKNFDIDNQPIEDLVNLARIINKDRVLYDVVEPLMLNGFNIYSPEFGPVFTSKNPKRDSVLGFTSDQTNDFIIFGWHLRLSWSEQVGILQPIGEKTEIEGNYLVRSKSKNFTRQCMSIAEALVIQKPSSSSSILLTDEIDELQPKLS